MSRSEIVLKLAFGSFPIAVGWAATQASIVRGFGALLGLAATVICFEYLVDRIQGRSLAPAWLVLWIRYSAIPVMMSVAMTILLGWDWWLPLAGLPLLALAGGIIAIAEDAHEARWNREHPDSEVQ